jgi:phage/plasmid-associated DNA primase
VIKTENAIQNYGEVLVEKAAPAILEWAIEGAVGFVQAGYQLQVPERVAMATEEYQAREDWLSNFIAECCTNGDRVAGGALYAAYRTWAESAGEYVRRQNDFVAALSAAGYKKITSNGRAYWTGIKLEAAQPFVSQRFG